MPNLFKNLFSRFKTSLATSKIAEEDVVVFIVGPTGAGESWIIIRAGLFQTIVSLSRNWSRLARFESADMVNIPAPETWRLERARLNNAQIMSSSSYIISYFGIVFLHTLSRDPTDPNMLMERHLNALLSSFPANFKAQICISVVSALEQVCKLGSDKIQTRVARLHDQRATLDKGRWTALELPTVFKGQPEVAWKVVQNLSKNITQ